MTGLAVVGIVGLAAAMGFGGWRIWCLHRAVTQVDDHLDAQLDRFWSEVRRHQDRQAQATEGRLRRVEAVVTQQGQGQEDLARRVAWMEPWVRHWVASIQEHRQ